MRASLVVAGLGAVMLASGIASAQARKLSVDEAVQLALDTNPALQAAAAQVRGTESQAKAVRGRLLPTVFVADELDHWNSAYVDMVSMSPTSPSLPFSVRDQNTNIFNAGVRQPLLGLGHLAHEYKAQTRAADATVAQLDTARSDLRAAVETFYLQLFEARALEQIARASEDELAEQVTIADARLKAGVLTRADVLRVRVSQANAKQQEIQAHAQAEVARANLLGRIGLALDDRSIDFDEPTQLLSQTSAPLPDVSQAERTALDARPEMKQRKLEAGAANEGAKASGWALLPEINVEAGYMRTDGTIFNPANAGYVMLKGQWAIWEWGASYYGHKAAAEKAQASDFQVKEQRAQGRRRGHERDCAGDRGGGGGRRGPADD